MGGRDKEIQTNKRSTEKLLHINGVLPKKLQLYLTALLLDVNYL